MVLNSSEQATLLSLARATLESAFLGDKPDVLAELSSDPSRLTPALRDPRPCFVTLYSGRKRLRGCIGALVAQGPLFENVHRYTLLAAFRDPRFRPVEKSETGGLHIHISVLGAPQPLPGLDALELGRHGLVVRHRDQHGVLLAQVAIEFGWTAEEFLKQTCLKAGLPPGTSPKYEVQFFEEVSFGEQGLNRK